MGLLLLPQPCDVAIWAVWLENIHKSDWWEEISKDCFVDWLLCTPFFIVISKLEMEIIRKHDLHSPVTWLWRLLPSVVLSCDRIPPLTQRRWRGTRPENTPICPPQGRARAPCLSEESEVLELKYAKKRNWRKLGQVVFLRSVSGEKWDLGSSTPKRYLPVYYSKTLKQPAGRWLWSPSCVERIMLNLVSTSHFPSLDNISGGTETHHWGHQCIFKFWVP